MVWLRDRGRELFRFVTRGDSRAPDCRSTPECGTSQATIIYIPENEIFCTFWVNNEVYFSGYCTGYNEDIGSGINNSPAGMVIAL